MVAEIQPHDIGNMLYNISTTTLTLTKAKKRWRRAFFTIKFSNTFAKNIIQLIPQPVADPGILSTGGSREPPKHPWIRHCPQLVVPEVRVDVEEVSDHQSHGIDQSQLINIVHNKDIETLRRFDGVKGLAKTLHTHLDNGINGQDLDERKTVFGTNSYEKPPLKGLLYFVAKALKDVTILVLSVCAVLSLGFGIKEDGIKDGWYEGGGILLAVFIVIVVSAVGNFRQEKQFDSLSKISNNIKIDVFREGRRQKISIFDIVVGDIVVLNIGDQIPGEGDQIDVNAVTNPFLISGTKVADGHCRMLVLSVGMNTAWGKMMSSIQDDNNEQTPLQSRVNKLTFSIRKVGLAVAFLVLVVMLVCYFTGNTKEEDKRMYNGKRTSANKILDSVMRAFYVVLTIAVVAIPEGLPLTVTLTLTYSLKRMLGDQAMVRKLFSCETMCSATVICTEKATETSRFVGVEMTM
ncbi:putative P-type Ca(2+) transporter [Helianthus annuus]|nr:putative P-type Ca(2+) transporter [Helianthus annuus]